MGIIKNVVNVFKTVKKARDDLNSVITLKSEEFSSNLKESNRVQRIEFYEEVKNDKNLVMASIKSDLFNNKITKDEYERLEQKINKALVDIEDGKISKEEFFNICIQNNK
jgi:hypothetical protein